MTASQPTPIYLTPHNPTVGAGLLAKAAWQLTQLDCVHIHCCGNGYLGFRSDSGSLWKRAGMPAQPKVTKGLLPPKSLANSGQRGLTGRLRSRSKAEQERLASHRGLCRYLWLSQASQLPQFYTVFSWVIAWTSALMSAAEVTSPGVTRMQVPNAAPVRVVVNRSCSLSSLSTIDC